jgi:hypothetical protein
MNDHQKSCMCQECQAYITAAFDEIEKMAMAWEVEASWRGWNLDEQPQWAGHDPSLPTVPQCSWHRWFAQDADRRAMIRAKVEAVALAQLIARES